MLAWDHSTWLAKRAREAAELGPPQLPGHVVLPGARTAIEHDMLVAYQDHGLDQHEIAAQINQNWHVEHAERLAEHREWVQGPYVASIRGMRELQAQAAAMALRQRVALERLAEEG